MNRCRSQSGKLCCLYEREKRRGPASTEASFSPGLGTFLAGPFSFSLALLHMSFPQVFISRCGGPRKLRHERGRIRTNLDACDGLDLAYACVKMGCRQRHAV